MPGRHALVGALTRLPPYITQGFAELPKVAARLAEALD
jgi:hypothetical protein